MLHDKEKQILYENAKENIIQARNSFSLLDDDQKRKLYSEFVMKKTSFSIFSILRQYLEKSKNISIRKRKVKYDCVRYGEYNISLASYIHILVITLKLWLTRNYRRFARGVSYCKHSIMIIPFWAVYIGLVYLIGKHRGETQTVADILWNSKSSLFSSIVIAAATAFFTLYSRDKNMYVLQHHLYKKMMGDFSQFYDLLLNISGLGRGPIKPPFDPFYYSKDIRSDIRNVFPESLDIERKDSGKEELLQCIDNLRKMMSEIADNVSKGLIDCTYVTFIQKMDSCQQCLERIEHALLQTAEIPFWGIMARDCVESMYDLLELIRRPWRRDLEYKIDILRTIYKEDTSVACTFYLQSFLGVVDYDSYKKTPEQIYDDFVKAFEKNGTVK